MADFYTGLKNTASKLLKDKGQTVNFSRDVAASHDPAAGIITPATAVTYSGSGAAFDYKASELVDGVIEAGDIKLILEATEEQPAIGDVATVDNTDYRVMDVLKTSPAGIVVKYNLQLRK